jgi:hypothetical protein
MLVQQLLRCLNIPKKKKGCHLHIPKTDEKAGVYKCKTGKAAIEETFITPEKTAIKPFLRLASINSRTAEMDVISNIPKPQKKAAI